MTSDSLSVRAVSIDDCSLLWRWANDPEVRAMSFRSDPIPWDHHVRWFHAKLADTNCRMYLTTLPDGETVGQVRFDLTPSGEAVIDVTIDPRFRGRGYGTLALRAACAEYVRSALPTKVYAYIKPNNIASLHAFRKARFVDEGQLHVDGEPAVRMRLETESEVPDDRR